MNIDSWQELERALFLEIEGWLKQYPSKPFVERNIRQVFSYYDRNKKKPDSKEGWVRAAASFLRNNWEEHVKASGSSKRASSDIDHKQKTLLNDKDINDKLASMRGRGKPGCPKCLGNGTIGAYRKPSQAYYSFLCSCEAGNLASQLREHQTRHVKTPTSDFHVARTRAYTELNPDEWVFDF